MTARLGRYRLDEELGRGGMAVVYAGVAEGEQGFRKPVVVKRIHPHLTRERRFVDLLIREAKLTVRLEHPNVVQVLELGRADDDWFIVLERVRGVDLAQLLAATQAAGMRFPPRLAGHVAREVLAALAYAHGVRGDDGAPLGVVHRDISPSNVMIARDGRVRLTDFGIARTAFGGEATEGGLKGKLAYMSPEQARGELVGPAGDLYGVGLVLFELLTGRRALEGDDELRVLAEAREGVLGQLERHAARIPEEYRPVLERALQREARDRHRDARAMREALVPLAHEAEAGQERLAELLALVVQEPREGGAAPVAETVPPPRTQTVVTRTTRPVGEGAPAERLEELATVPGLGGRPWWLAGVAAVAVGLAVGVVWWSPWDRERPDGGEAMEAKGEPEEAAASSGFDAVADSVEEILASQEPSPATTSTPAREPITHREAAASSPLEVATDEPPADPAPAPAPAAGEPVAAAPGAGTISLVVEGGTGLVHVAAPGWVDRYAPLPATEVAAGRWPVTVRNADGGVLWMGTVEVPDGGTVGVLLQRGPGGRWTATVR